MIRAHLKSRIADLISRASDGSSHDSLRDALIADLATYQAERIPAYQRLFTHPHSLAVPAIPTDVFRFARIATHREEDDIRRFHTSGTTQDHRGVHAFRELELYDLAAEAAARYALFPDLHPDQGMSLIVLAPHPTDLPDSSLSYMLGRFEEWFAAPRDVTCTWVWKEDQLQLEPLRKTLANAETQGRPVALLGTSFAFVHAMEGLSQHYSLPPGSRIMQTGGFKGKSRDIDPETMRCRLSDTFSIPDSWIVAEYGMTELSSQMYETTLRAVLHGDDTPKRALWAPGWLRVTPIDPEHLIPSRSGILRIDDPVNLDSCACIQTSDFGERTSDGFLLHGRAASATPRGCSLAADAILSKPISSQ